MTTIDDEYDPSEIIFTEDISLEDLAELENRSNNFWDFVDTDEVGQE